jgi:hypothetical protein
LAEAWLPGLASEGAIEEAAREVAAGRRNPYRWVRDRLQAAQQHRID